ncbi:hypothetical protein OM291_25570, partial [Escherichia albertii]|nr:hypothetical protein [Escherichia albertii]
REDNPLTRITRTVLYIYTKNCIQEGDRNSCNPLLMELSAPSNFYTREKYFMLVGMMPIWGFP